MFIYTEEKKFTKEQVQQLFLSVNWISGNYPERLYKALMNSSTVLTVWNEEKLVGLTRVLDDTEMIENKLEKRNIKFRNMQRSLQKPGSFILTLIKFIQ